LVNILTHLTSLQPPLAESTANALQNRPDLQAMRAMENLAEAQIEQARAGGRVDASVNAGYGRNNFGFPVNGITDAGQIRPVQGIFHSFKFGVTLEIRFSTAIKARLKPPSSISKPPRNGANLPNSSFAAKSLRLTPVTKSRLARWKFFASACACRQTKI
jgi:hypothetical protein